jgi:serine/threonine-protein kinase RsbT
MPAAIDPAYAGFYISRESDIAQAMLQARSLAQSLGFDRLAVSFVATAATEMASNVWRHAGGGVFEVRATQDCGIELMTSDKGPGIADIALALKPGYSTAATLGCGLAGVKALMDSLEITSPSGGGTRVRARKWK